MSDNVTLVFSIFKNLFQNNLFLIYAFSILISIIGDINVALKIEKRLDMNDIEFTENFNIPKNKNKFLISVGMILFFSIISLNFEYFSIENSLSISIGIFLLSLIYLIGHTIAEVNVAQTYLTRDEEIITKLTSDLDLVHMIIAPVKALIYLFVGIKNILSKKNSYE